MVLCFKLISNFVTLCLLFLPTIFCFEGSSLCIVHIPLSTFSPDGNMILSLTESDLQPIFNMTDPMHQKAFLFAIDLLREDGIKMPANLWEYKVKPISLLFLFNLSTHFSCLRKTNEEHFLFLSTFISLFFTGV